ncbi:ybbR-like protein [Clostridium sp. CAG:433]|jgi:YbbR domain-containing protein|nr:ybbR-like protein [Clostridium sp. CAG:433]
MKLIKRFLRFIDKKIIVPITKFFVSIGEKLKLSDKPLEKALSKKSSMIILSLVLAVIVFVIIDRQNTTLLEKNAEVLYDIPLSATYNDEEYVVEGLPETVDITLIGTKANLYLAKQLPTQDVNVDLSDLKPGVHKVNLKYKQSITSVEYKLDPSEVTVVVSSKKSETRSVESDIVNLNKLDSKLAINNTKLDTDEVIIKGTEDSLSKVSTIKALINVSNMVDPKSGTNTLKDIPLIAYDENGAKVDVEMVPSKVTATIEIESPSKTVPLEIEPTGNVIFGKAIKNITSSVQKVTIYGSSKVLDNTNSIKVKIDVNNLKSNKDYTVTIKKPAGIREISEKVVTAKVELDDEVTTELSGVKLGVVNLGSNYTAQATSENATEVTVILKGVESIIKNITSSDVEAYVDLEGLGAGDHEVEIKVKGTDPKVKYSSKVTKTIIKIAEK